MAWIWDARRWPTADIQTWAVSWNKNPRPFAWTETADQILERLAAYCATINSSA